MNASIRQKAKAALVASRSPKVVRPVLTSAGCGLIDGTRVATPGGWGSVQSINVGDEVLTFDAGFQRVAAVITDTVFDPEQVTPRGLWPVRVPAGVLDNRQDLLVQPHQGVLVESPDVRDKWGDPYAVIPGAALEVLQGVERVAPEGALQATLLVFAEDQMVFANGGALMFCQAHWGARVGVMPRFGSAANYNLLPMRAATALLEMGAVRTVDVCPEVALAVA